MPVINDMRNDNLKIFKYGARQSTLYFFACDIVYFFLKIRLKCFLLSPNYSKPHTSQHFLTFPVLLLPSRTWRSVWWSSIWWVSPWFSSFSPTFRALEPRSALLAFQLDPSTYSRPANFIFLSCNFQQCHTHTTVFVNGSSHFATFPLLTASLFVGKLTDFLNPKSVNCS